jgi:hypothetical protein
MVAPTSAGAYADLACQNLPSLSSNSMERPVGGLLDPKKAPRRRGRGWTVTMIGVSD